MTRNPIVNASAASVYIVAVAALLYYGRALVGEVDSFLVPIAFLSLFVLSAAVMAFLFLYQPLALYFEGNKMRSVNLFLQTVAVFGGITLLLIAALFVVGRTQGGP